MKSRKLLRRLALIIVVLVISGAYFSLSHKSILAAEVQNNQTVNAKKLLKIVFNKEISFDDSTKQGIAIKDSKGNSVNITLDLGKDKKALLINPPVGGYVPGEKYTLDISKSVHSDNLKLYKSVSTQFKVSNENIPKPTKINREAKYGDIVGTAYKFDIYQYEHYGIYIGDNKVIHYSSSDGTMKNAKIEIGNMEENFPKGKYFVLDFGNDAKFSPDATVKRAKSRLGEKNYNLITNNCEHFAVWCKTDNAKSYQIDSLSRSQIQLLKQYADTGIIPSKNLY
ncbi:hypothetical protein AGR56_07265 [Clostridium sp. DMHC 10]|uniref:lecithin retinol acyltransferase family protein n=1 Tax=Clostridium sp. DMHC 10 TaxID=747377 RepID=UPI00069E8A61|nr:lecithin retinol acyltransferase family protein [Clostridium sp. DMHC 10]KOF56553.1 hypothetical protein AGR56_07265 [Clostridium sp. DMHC 10]